MTGTRTPPMSTSTARARNCSSNELFVREGFDEPIRFLGFEADGHVDVRSEPRAAPDEHRLGTEHVPGRAYDGEPSGERSEQVSRGGDG